MNTGLESVTDVTALRERTARLRAEIAAAERKSHGLSAAIESRKRTLNRLLAKLALAGERAPALHPDE